MGKSKQLLTLCGVTVPLLYHSTKKAWITGKLFSSILVDFNKQSTENCVMLIDNTGSHTIPIAQAKLNATKVIALPPNTTALLQPNNQGIIAAFKACYRKHMLCQIHTRMEAKIAELSLQDPPKPMPQTQTADVTSKPFFVNLSDRLLLGHKRVFSLWCNELPWSRFSTHESEPNNYY